MAFKGQKKGVESAVGTIVPNSFNDFLSSAVNSLNTSKVKVCGVTFLSVCYVYIW